MVMNVSSKIQTHWYNLWLQV